MPTTDAPLIPSDAAQMLPHKAFDVTFTSLDETGSFVMTAAVFGNVDKGGDVISPGAFDNLPEFAKEGWVALSHDQKALPIAIVDTANQDANGLQITGRFHSTEFAQECRTVFRERMMAGKTVKASIGYVTNDEAYERVNGKQVRRLKALSLYEVSFVNLPMNPLAYVRSVKSLTDPEDPPMPETPPETEVKRSVAVSAANHKMLSAYADQMEEHHKAMVDIHKQGGQLQKAAHKTLCEMKAFVGGFKPGEKPGDSEDDAEPDSDEDDKKPAKKPEKAKSALVLTADQKATAVLRDQLHIRSLHGRKTQACP